jgi:hypothetical protein
MGAEEEKLVEKSLARLGLEAIRFSKEERRAKKTPDFRVFKNSKFCFYCEEKTVDGRNEQSPSKPRMDRVADKIHEAVEQFDSVNIGPEKYNVLVICNKDKDLNHLVLCAYVGGLKVTDGRTTFGASAPLGDANDRIKEDRFRIHLYIWFNLLPIKSYFIYYTREEEEIADLLGYFKRENLKESN